MQSKSINRTAKPLMTRPVQRLPFETFGAEVTAVVDAIVASSSEEKMPG
jgi:hypothetical protein